MKLTTIGSLCLILALACTAWADTTAPGTFKAPTVKLGAVTTSIYWSAGTVYNGGHSVAITAGSAALGASKTDCTYPSYTSCDILYANSVGTVAVTVTIGTAAAAGNTILAFIETTAGSVPSNIVLPLQSGALWTNAASVGGGAAVTVLNPSAAGTVDLGSATLPYEYLYFSGTSGTPATNNFRVTGASTSGTRVATFPDASITVSGATGQSCGTANACSATNISSTLKIVSGITAALDGASPAVAAVTGISPAFTSTTSYACTGTLEGNTALTQVLAVTQVSGSAVTFTATNGANQKVHYICVGN